MRTRGFTLIELMVTIAIAAILMVVATPSFVGFQRNSELTAAANGLLAGMNTARSEALKRGAVVRLVPLVGTTWQGGYRIYVDTDRTGTPTATDVPITQSSEVPAFISIVPTGTAAGGAPFLEFNGSGFGTNATFSYVRNDVPAAERPQQTRNVIVFQTGRVRVCKPTGAADPNCNTSDSNNV